MAPLIACYTFAVEFKTLTDDVAVLINYFRSLCLDLINYLASNVVDQIDWTTKE